jgi:hypothetical protein
MAGDWIKMRTSLCTNPKVNGIAKVLESDCAVGRAMAIGFSGCMSKIVTRNVMRHVTVSSLLIVWGAANEHTRDGVFVNSELSDIDDMTGIPGFGRAMASVGWATYDADTYSVTLPNFNEYNISGSARSAQAKTGAQRQKEFRDRKRLRISDVTRDDKSDELGDRREEKKRQEKNKHTVGEAPLDNSGMVERDHPVCVILEKAGIQHVNILDPEFTRLTSEPMATLDVWKWAASHAVEKQNPKFQFVLGIVRNRIQQTTTANAAPEGHTPDPLQDPNTKASIEARGVAQGIGVWDGTKESFVAYRVRVDGTAGPQSSGVPSIPFHVRKQAARRAAFLTAS